VRVTPRSPGSTIVGLDHVQVAIRVGGEDAARRFYGALLGLTEVPKPAPLAARGGCWFVGSGVAIHLGAEADFRPARKAHLALLVDDLDGLRGALDVAGVPTKDDEASIGVRRFYAEDPFGNRLELVDRRDAGFTERVRTS
jgi:catechol 2,3-dioxygenase-like lactoylglutathione lyase family enzyme